MLLWGIVSILGCLLRCSAAFKFEKAELVIGDSVQSVQYPSALAASAASGLAKMSLVIEVAAVPSDFKPRILQLILSPVSGSEQAHIFDLTYKASKKQLSAPISLDSINPMALKASQYELTVKVSGTGVDAQSWALGVLVLPETQNVKETAAAAIDEIFYPQTEFRDESLFVTPKEKRTNAQVTIITGLLLLSPWIAFRKMLKASGSKPAPLPSTLYAFMFSASLVVLFALTILSWARFDIFQTIGWISLAAVPAMVTGFKCFQAIVLSPQADPLKKSE